MKANYDFSNAKRGAVKPAKGKTRITIYLDDDVLTHFRDVATEEGLGYQTVINRTLRAAMTPAQAAGVPKVFDASSMLIDIKNSLDEMNQRLAQATQAPPANALYAGMGEVLLRQPGYEISSVGATGNAIGAPGGYPALPIDVKPVPAKKKASKFSLRSPRGGRTGR